MNRTLSVALATGLAGAAVLGAQGVASACATTTYAPIAQRLGTLNAKLADLKQHSSLTPADAGKLYAIITSDVSGLTKLNDEIQWACNKHELAELKFDVYRDFRVYVLVGPQFDLSSAADAGAKAAAGLQGQEPSLQKDATTAPKQAEYRNLVYEVNTALKILPGIGPYILAQTPFTDFQPAVERAGSELGSGLTALDKAETDATLIEG